MHIAEGFLPPAHAIGWTIASAPFVVHGARAVVKEVREHPESTLLLGAAGAFTFVLSAIKLPSVTGNVHASYLHLNWAGSPTMAARFVGAAAVLARREVLSAHR